MYEALTAFIPFMESGNFGDWSERVGDGTPENPYVMCHIDYNEQIIRLNHVLHDFEKAHDLLNFHEILKKSGMNFGGDAIITMDVSSLDGKTIIAMIRLVFSMERFCDGTILEFCRNGCFLRWLQRLKALDDAGEDTM